MKFWSLSDPAAEPDQPIEGFSDVLKTLAERKYREQRGPAAAAPERTRRAVAAVRAREEMARRVAQYTGKKRLAQATIARRARQDRPPPGVERVWLQRWEAIDRAGGIPALARQLGTTPARVRAWRDSPDPTVMLPTRPPGRPEEVTSVGVETTGTVWINGNPYPKRFPENAGQDYAVLDVEPDGEIIEAWLAGDTDALKAAVEEAIVEQLVWPYWGLPSTHTVSYSIDDTGSDFRFLPEI